MSSLTTAHTASAYPHHFDSMVPNPLVAEAAACGGEGMTMSKVMQSAQNIYLLSRVGTKRGLDQPALKRMLRELCDLESQLTNISPESSPVSSPRGPSSPVADVCSSPSSPSSSPSLSTSSSSSSTSSAVSTPSSSSSSASKRNISKNKKKQLRRRSYVCSGCGATESSQWRNGPDGTKICNPCGMKFWRLKRKMLKRQSEDVNGSTASSSSSSSSNATHLQHLRPTNYHHHQTSSTAAAAAALGLQHLRAVQPTVATPAYYPLPPFHQQHFRGGYPAFPPSLISNNQQNDEEVMAAGVMMQHLRTASFSSITKRGSGLASASPEDRSRSSSSASLSSLLSSPSSSLSLSFSSLSSPSTSPSPSPTPDGAAIESERKRSSIYDLLN